MSGETEKISWSESISKLTEAMAKAQAKMTPAAKDQENPHFKSKFADLAACWDVARAPLSENGLAVFQPACVVAEGVTVVTLLSHVSGEWMCAELTLPLAQKTPQAVGSAISYGRRYSFSSMLGIVSRDEDDDGSSASCRDDDGWRGRDDREPPRQERQFSKPPAQTRGNGNGHHEAKTDREVRSPDGSEAMATKQGYDMRDHQNKNPPTGAAPSAASPPVRGAAPAEGRNAEEIVAEINLAPTAKDLLKEVEGVDVNAEAVRPAYLKRITFFLDLYASERRSFKALGDDILPLIFRFPKGPVRTELGNLYNTALNVLKRGVEQAQGSAA